MSHWGFRLPSYSKGKPRWSLRYSRACKQQHPDVPSHFPSLKQMLHLPLWIGEGSSGNVVARFFPTLPSCAFDPIQLWSVSKHGLGWSMCVTLLRNRDCCHAFSALLDWVYQKPTTWALLAGYNLYLKARSCSLQFVVFLLMLILSL